MRHFGNIVASSVGSPNGKSSGTPVSTRMTSFPVRTGLIVMLILEVPFFVIAVVAEAAVAARVPMSAGVFMSSYLHAEVEGRLHELCLLHGTGLIDATALDMSIIPNTPFAKDGHIIAYSAQYGKTAQNLIILLFLLLLSHFHHLTFILLFIVLLIYYLLFSF